MGEVALAWTKGFQYHPATTFLQGVITLKHLVANSLEDSDGQTRTSIDVNVSNYMLQDAYFPAFKTPIREGHARG